LLSTENCMTSSPLAGYVDLANTTVARFTGIHYKPAGSAAMIALMLEHCPDTEPRAARCLREAPRAEEEESA
jgi:hypothetical protein